MRQKEKQICNCGGIDKIAAFVNGTEGGTTNLVVFINKMEGHIFVVGEGLTNSAAFVNGVGSGDNKPGYICKWDGRKNKFINRASGIAMYKGRDNCTRGI